MPSSLPGRCRRPATTWRRRGAGRHAAPAKRTVGVGYELTQYTLSDLEEELVDKGFHLDNTLLSKLTRALIHYIEETQLHNLDAPAYKMKRSNGSVHHMPGSSTLTATTTIRHPNGVNTSNRGRGQPGFFHQ